MDFDVNYLTVLAAAVSSFVLGFLWYGPLFGKQWVKAMGWTEENLKMERPWIPYLISFISAFVMATVLAYVLEILDAATLGAAFKGGALVWLGFVATVMARSYAYGKENALALWLLDGGYILAELVVMGLILVSWM